MRVSSESHQHIHVAIGFEVITQCGAKQGQLAHLPAAAELSELGFMEINHQATHMTFRNSLSVTHTLAQSFTFCKWEKHYDPFDEFGRYLADQGRGELTVAGYSQDLALFARWFEHTNGERLTSAALTLTDAWEYCQHLLRHKARPATTPALALRASAVRVSTAIWLP